MNFCLVIILFREQLLYLFTVMYDVIQKLNFFHLFESNNQ